MNARWLTSAIVVLCASACGDEMPPVAAGSFNNAGQQGSSCGTPQDGCPCTTPGKVVECGKVQSQVGDEVRCQMGNRTCIGTKWGACEGDTGTRSVRTASRQSGIKPLALATTTTTCGNDACDPYCQQFNDTPIGIVPPTGLTVTPVGLTLSQTGTFDITGCTLVVTPATQTLTITSLSPVSPSTLAFTASLTGCTYPGTIEPVWTVNDARADAVTISGAADVGTLQAVAPIAGPVTVTAHVGSLVGNATAFVNVDVVDSTEMPSAANHYNGAGGSGDNVTWLYPYTDTVFPLGLPPIIPQWSSPTAADSVKLTLRYDDGAGTSYQWSAIAPENHALTIVAPSVSIAADKRYTNIPTNAWFFFERSAKGRDAQIVLRRRVAGNTLETPRTIHFANGQLKGNVYYQSYGTRLTQNYGGAQDSSGGVTFPSGNFGAATLRIDPGATAPTVVAGQTPGNVANTSGAYCRVCHTASADGSVLITQRAQPSTRQSEIVTNLTTTPTATAMGADNGNYAWPAIFPSGGFLFGNGGIQTSYNNGPPPGGLDGANSDQTNHKSSFWTIAATPAARAATYRTGGGTPLTITVPDAAWGLRAAVPSFSSTGAKIAMMHYGGRVCATGNATNCTADELLDGDKRSLAIMDYNAGTSQLSNFRRLVTEPNTACNTAFHPYQPCHDVWPTFLPNDTGVVYEKEIFHNGSIASSSNPLSDFGGTRSGCDNGGNCSNDGTKGELWWVPVTGGAAARLNRANGLTAGGANDLPTGANSSYCRVTGFACGAAGDCCSNNCSNGRCIGNTIKRAAGAACGSAGDCNSNVCTLGVCGCLQNSECVGGGACALGICATGFAAAPTMYVPGHSAAIEPYLSYEPTMNPTPTKAADGTTDEFYWVVFTSRRMFGNIATQNPWWSDPRHHNLSQSVNTKKLWVAAIRANPGAGSDPSYPAFYLPGQEWVSGNSKAYWVNDACRAGTTAAAATATNLCDTTADCCAGSTCKLDYPLASPATRHCITAAACTTEGGACSTGADCCSGFFCSGGTCQAPPPLAAYANSVIYTRVFRSPCPVGTQTIWSELEIQGIFALGSSINFSARSGPDEATVGAATPVVAVGTANTTTLGWTPIPSPVQKIDTLLKNGGGGSSTYLAIDMDLRPSSNLLNAPILTNWRVNVECVPAE